MKSKFLYCVGIVLATMLISLFAFAASGGRLTYSKHVVITDEAVAKTKPYCSKEVDGSCYEWSFK